MEMFELRYFAAVAETENIHKAAEKLNVSASALSKAISRLEEEFKVSFFQKNGRNIRLTSEGRKLQSQCSKFFELESETRTSVSGVEAEIEVRMAGPEVFLSHFGVDLSTEIRQSFPNATFQFFAMSEADAENAVLRKVADICILTEQNQKKSQLKYRNLEKIKFQTYVGKGHPLYKSQKPVPIEEVLSYDFLTPAENLFGLIQDGSNDGWRDDKFLRKIRFKDVGLKTLETLLLRGQVIAYLPPYFANSLPIRKLKILDCPYSCEQEIVMAAKEFWSKL